MGQFLQLRSSEQMLDALRNAAGGDMTADEVLQQRVSFVFGSIDPDNGVTRERVRELILEGEGRAEAR